VWISYGNYPHLLTNCFYDEIENIHIGCPQRMGNIIVVKNIVLSEILGFF